MRIGAVLAGGRSSRMGEPKAGVELGGRPLAGRIVAAVGSAGLEPVVVAKPDSPLPRLSCRVLSEPGEPRHPLTGIVTAIGASSGRGVVVVACDMPFVPAPLIGWLARLEDDFAVCRVGGRFEPLLGRYPARVAEPLRESLETGNSMRDAVAALEPRIVEAEELSRFGDPERIVFNVNSAEDLRRAEAMLAGGG